MIPEEEGAGRVLRPARAWRASASGTSSGRIPGQCPVPIETDDMATAGAQRLLDAWCVRLQLRHDGAFYQSTGITMLTCLPGGLTTSV